MDKFDIGAESQLSNSQHFIFFVTYNWSQYAKVFIPGRHFQTDLLFETKAGAYLSVDTFTLGWKSLPRANALAYRGAFVNYEKSTAL